MGSNIEAKGKCLCGMVEVHAKSFIANVGACHCSICRKWGGGPLFAIDCNEDLEISGTESVSTYDSSEWAERGFCSKCGTHLFFRLKQQNLYIVPAGLLDLKSDPEFKQQVFIEEKPGYYCFSNETQNLTGEELFALYMS